MGRASAARAAASGPGSGSTRAGSGERTGSRATSSYGDGARPGMLASGCVRSDSIVGTEATSAAVYGWAGPTTSVATSSSSTIRPAYITSTRLHSCETTATSCEITIAAEPPEVLTSRSSCRICCCTVTSRAVVGSSAMISFGSLIRPIAITARWRIPPENSCGYWRTRAGGIGDADGAQAVDRPLRRRRLREPVVHLGHLGELPADTQRGVEG